MEKIVSEHKILVLDRTVNLSKNAIILIIIERYFIVNVQTFKCKLPVNFVRFELWLILFDRSSNI